MSEPERIRDGSRAARIGVQDLGSGLHAAQVDRLFGAFYTTTTHGMALAIGRSIIPAAAASAVA